MTDPLERLERLARLKSLGALTEEEFAAEKGRILGQHDEEVVLGAGAPDEAAPGIRPKMDRKELAAASAACIVLLGAAAYFGSDIGSSVRPTGRSALLATGSENRSEGEAGVVGFIDFQSAATCEPGEALSGMMTKLARASSQTEAELDIPGSIEPVQPVIQRFSGPSGSGTIRQIPLAGKWHGLQLMALRTSDWDSGTFSSLQLRFANTASQAKRQLEGAGFTLGPVGEPRRVKTPAQGRLAVGVESLAEGSALTCVRDTRSTGSVSGSESNA